MNQRHEQAGDVVAKLHGSASSSSNPQHLLSRAADGDGDPSAFGELLQQRLGDVLRRGRDDDRVVRRVLGQALMAIPREHHDVAHPESPEHGPRAVRQLFEQLDPEDFSTHLPQERCGVTRARAHFEDTVVRSELECVEHHRDHRRLADGLSQADGQSAVGVGHGSFLRRHELVARNRQKRCGDPGIPNHTGGEHRIHQTALLLVSFVVRRHVRRACLRRWLGTSALVLTTAATAAGPACPPEMARGHGYCIDRWEASLVERDSGKPLSPYYPPHAGMLQRVFAVWSVERLASGGDVARGMPLPPVPAWQRGAFQPRALSQPGVIPNAYLSYPLARRACENAGKRLCTEDEWVRACRGASPTAQPYGGRYVAGRCNVFRPMHPAVVLHGHASFGHTDPRLNLLIDNDSGPLLRTTGELSACSSRAVEGEVFDMVGNLDEWIADEGGVFVGGFFARSTTRGCEAKIASHAPVYYDYSLGTRCCRDLTSRGGGAVE